MRLKNKLENSSGHLLYNFTCEFIDVLKCKWKNWAVWTFFNWVLDWLQGQRAHHFINKYSCLNVVWVISLNNSLNFFLGRWRWQLNYMADVMMDGWPIMAKLIAIYIHYFVWKCKKCSWYADLCTKITSLTRLMKQLDIRFQSICCFPRC